jgi:acid phosphatase (class A)
MDGRDKPGHDDVEGYMRKYLLPFIALLFCAPAFAADAPPAPPYITLDQVDFTHLLAPPPAPGTAEQQRDIAAVLTMRANASAAERERAVADAEITPYRFADVLGPKFRENNLPKTDAFFKHVLDSIGPFIGAGKNYWHHDRPFVMDPNVRSPDAMIKGVCNDKGPGSPPTALCPRGINYSYPSGHSTYGTVVATLLGEMVPEKREALLARGRQYGDSRVINGVHFPTDVEAGRVEGTVMVVLMMQNERFRADLAEAKAELRQVLGFSP